MSMVMGASPSKGDRRQVEDTREKAKRTPNEGMYNKSAGVQGVEGVFQKPKTSTVGRDQGSRMRRP